MSSRIPPKPKRSASSSHIVLATRKHYVVVGAGMAGVVCARTLQQAGHQVTVIEAQPQVGGRMASRHSAHGSFDVGAQFFTVRDPRFQLALDTTPNVTRHWSVNAIRTLDATGKVAVTTQRGMEAHLVGVPTMDSLLASWAAPLTVRLNEYALAFERDALNPQQWQLRTEDVDGGVHVYAGLDGIVLAIPSPEAQELLADSETHVPADWQLSDVYIAPSWTLLLTFAHAVDPSITNMGPQWNAARTEHPRITWLSRESSKPGRGKVERWTVQASPDWARKHENDEPQRVAAKMLQAFSELTRIRATPSDIRVVQWGYAKTINPLPKDAKGQARSHLWNAKSAIGLCGDWCLGYRVEDAFVSGLELALAVLGE
ncbi:NAD(P)/FAD-dependent oxidoreductase [Comamonas koreensis]|uniref:FAD-dependent oxidoreductase n=1 Tax=Comamonas koreensis TaxID=160825 RepID=A0AAW4XYQ8_9BURK|nr:FAD-dependent oxidoreductase [Comamonas koreensis]MCD2166582.1 FAD-dependent oxidoreductase [Comamonas koreensis]